MSTIGIIFLIQSICFLLFVLFASISYRPHRSFSDYLHNLFEIEFEKFSVKEIGTALINIIIFYIIAPFLILYITYNLLASLFMKENHPSNSTTIADEPARKPNIIHDFVADREYPLFPMQYLYFNDDSISFQPNRKELIYIDSNPNSDISQFIAQHIDDFTEYVATETGCSFIHLSNAISKLNNFDSYHYFNPQSEEANFTPNDIAKSHSWDLISQCFLNPEIITRGFIFFPSDSYNGGESRFAYMPVPSRDTRPVEHILPGMCRYIKDTHPLYSLEKFNADAYFNFDTEKMMSEIIDRVKALRQRGVTEAIIASLFKQEISLSRLHITADFKIILPDYNNMEIHLTPLPKAVFSLFLRHPDGILFKDLPDYYDELLNIYSQLTGRKCDKEIKKSIKDVTDPTKNSINEKCARIKEAFVSQFHDEVAKHYFVTGQRGEPKKIILPRELVDWTFNL